MANQKLFIDATAHMAPVGNSMSTKYCYNQKGQLTIFRNGRKVAERIGVKLGDAFIVSCDGNTSIHRLNIPHRNSDLLMWLLSFNKENRAYSAAEYKQLLAIKSNEYYWRGYCSWGIEGEGYAFTLCNRSDCGGVVHMAAFVDRKVDKVLVKEVFLNWGRGIYWPRSFVENLLRNRFGFTDADLAELDEVHWWR